MGGNYAPRSYQEACLESISTARNSGANKALVVMASGLGKTLTSIFDIQRYLKAKPDSRILVLCHTEDILRQTKETFKKVFGDEYSYGMYNANQKTTHWTNFMFANLQSVNLHKEDFGADDFAYVIVDEAHHSPAKTYQKAIEHFRPEFLLGMTATPERMDDADLAEIFGESVYEYRLADAIHDGWLSNVRYLIKVDELQKLGQILDGNEAYSFKRLNREIFIPKRDEEIAHIIRTEIADKQDPTMVIFCQTIEHANRFAEIMGNAVVIHSEMSREERNKRLHGFRTGKIKTVCAVDILNEGIDVPRTDVIVFLRVTQSRIIFTQQLGRGLRRAKGKDEVLVLDFVANADRLDMIFQLKRDFKVAVARRPQPRGSTEKMSIEIATPNFQHREVDIIELLENARGVRSSLTDEELIQKLKDFGSKHGRPPFQCEARPYYGLPSHEVYRMRFGSFSRALALAGFPSQRVVHEEFTVRDEIIAALQRKAKELKRTPRKIDIDSDPDMPSTSLLCKEFGSINNAIIAAGLPVNKFIVSLSDEEMLELLRQKAAKIGATPTIAEVDADPNMPNEGSYNKRFGSYNKAIKKAGLVPNARHVSYGFRPVDDEFYLEQLRKKTRELGRLPKVKEVMDDPSMDSPNLFYRRFGNFTNAFRLAGLMGLNDSVYQKYSDEDLLDLLRQMAQRTGKMPTSQAIQDDHEMPSLSVFIKRFGKLSEALQKAGLK